MAFVRQNALFSILKMRKISLCSLEDLTKIIKVKIKSILTKKISETKLGPTDPDGIPRIKPSWKALCLLSSPLRILFILLVPNFSSLGAFLSHFCGVCYEVWEFMKYLSYVALQKKPCFTFSPLHGVVTCHILNGEMIKSNEYNVTEIIAKVGRGEMRKERWGRQIVHIILVNISQFAKANWLNSQFFQYSIDLQNNLFIL